MEWLQILLAGLGILLFLFVLGVPVFVAFLFTNLVGAMYFFGGRGFSIFTNSIYDTLASSSLATIALFILMGEVLFRSGATDAVFRSTDTLIGRVKGRDFVLSAALGTIFGALSGAAMGVVAMLGRSLLPQMLARGSDRRLSIGAILGGANLAPIIPPSVLIIVIGMLANISISRFLIAGIIPGLIIACLILLYTSVRIAINPGLAGQASQHDVPVRSFKDKVVAVIQLLPFSVIIFFVMGFILLGIATPSESAASGVVGALLAAAYYKKLSFRMILESVQSAAAVSAVILIIMASSKLFSQLLSLSGATSAIAQLSVATSLDPLVMLFIMMLIPFIFCMFMDQIAISIVIIPIYAPVIAALGFDPLWFWVLFLINVTIGGFSPPFGYVLFAFKAAAPELKVSDLYAAAWPFVGVFILAMVIIAMFPALVTWLPGML
ncbi:MAG: TRAP transporter large permease [Halomonadaceae bacterium]|jgi:tripartite ATP-independent transporter DctM subunit|uniref:TRAP transporter large permease n=1 Tax=Halomonas sp. MCCC 1A11062 TaxID=2733485 RepID=UPI001F2312B9|nr:TRAP transporter large permease [Halomonas sp. MCCC 1A11062]MCE8038964.1 TRAP transporter large permease [Halomonas sp. MCCC 1A11062]